ncbi:hypothetical protein midi_01061 [Candidatus Midichloria mitochondrii IricVA]|uniref:Uncharacterized protein n=1 Tax=Midichloria mitochondrii (strain IricVA) TaxID=696127 RepID=F7XTX9_MIDMI|nr:hypothetical protein midi_01061 [Candidatus Midichloria mitochondrii IricVA]
MICFEKLGCLWSALQAKLAKGQKVGHFPLQLALSIVFLEGNRPSVPITP